MVIALLRHTDEQKATNSEFLSFTIAKGSVINAFYTPGSREVHLNIYCYPDIYAYSVQVGELCGTDDLTISFEREDAVTLTARIVGAFVTEMNNVYHDYSEALALGDSFCDPEDLRDSTLSASLALVKAMGCMPGESNG